MIGYIGLGAMGSALATHLARKDGLLVWDLNADALQTLIAAGAQAATSARDLGERCEIIFLCLPKSENVCEVLFGEDGLARSIRPGSIVVDQTSGSPAETAEFSEQLGALGIDLIDAPVAGGVPLAIAGQITIMASGPRESYDRVLPAFQSITPKVFHCGSKVGSAQALKAINNIANASCRIMTLEILALSRGLGLTAREVTDALNKCDARSFVTQRLLPAVVENRSSTDFSLGLMVKDLNQAIQIGVGAVAPMPIADTARGVIHYAYNLLGQASRLDDIVGFMERATAISFTAQCIWDTVEGPLPPNRAISQIVETVALGNRFIMLENFSLAQRAGLRLEEFAPVLLSGSAYSRQGELLLASLRGGSSEPEQTIGEMLSFLTVSTNLGARFGIPMLMVNQIRARCLDKLQTLGADATFAQLCSHQMREADPSTGQA